MTTTTSAAGGRRLTRDPDDDTTRVFVRPDPDAWDRLMVSQIMSELESEVRVRPARAAILQLPSAEPNVFLDSVASDPPPPWAVRQSLEKTVGKRARLTRRRSKRPWLVFAVSFAIGFGVLQDPALRHQTSSQIQSSALRLYSLVSSIR